MTHRIPSDVVIYSKLGLGAENTAASGLNLVNQGASILSGVVTAYGDVQLNDNWLDGGTIGLFKSSTGQYIFGDYSSDSIMFIRSDTSGKYGRLTAAASNVKYDCVGTGVDLLFQSSDGHIGFWPNATETIHIATTGMRIDPSGSGDPTALLEVVADPGTDPSNSNAICALNLENATVGVQKVSPPVLWKGSGWKTDATAGPIDTHVRAFITPVQGATQPSVGWALQSSIGGSAYTDMLTIDSDGGSVVATVATTAINTGGVFGNAVVGVWNGGTGFTVFAHSSVAQTTGSYALIQQNDGSTYLNAADQKLIRCRINNADIMQIAVSGVAINTTPGSATLDLNQDDTGAAVPVLKVAQTDVSEEFIRFVGESTTDDSQSLVDASDLPTPGTIQGWLKVYIEDTQSTGPITDGVYYMPFYDAPT